MKVSKLVLLALCVSGPVHAAEEPPASREERRQEAEKRLDEARQRLEEAAREVAALSMEIGAPLIEQFVDFVPRRAIIGVQLDAQSGADGARIVEVSPGGPAAQAGIQAGDVIVAVDGRELKGSENPVREVTRRLREVEPESRVKLRILRNGKARDVEVAPRVAVRVAPRLPDLPLPPDVPPGEHFDFMHTLRGELAGMELATLTPELGRYFGTDKGVLVVRAPESSTFRLEDGDVILSVDGREPKNGTHATRILRSYQPGEKVRLRVMRQKKPLDLEILLPEAAPRERRVRGAPGTELSIFRGEHAA